MSRDERILPPGATHARTAKAQAGCEVRILISAPDSVWVTTPAAQLGQDDDDCTGTNALQREIELVRGHLEPLLQQPNVELRRFYTDRVNSILHFDEQMLLTLSLWGTQAVQAPLLHLRRGSDDGLFDQFA
jgi:hypothetical protein